MTEVTKEQKEWLLKNKYIEENTSEEDIVKAFEKYADDWKKYLNDKLKEEEAKLDAHCREKYEEEKSNTATEQNDVWASEEFQNWKKDYIEKHPEDKEVQELVKEIERIKTAIEALEKNQPQVQATQQAQSQQAETSTSLSEEEMDKILSNLTPEQIKAIRESEEFKKFEKKARESGWDGDNILSTYLGNIKHKQDAIKVISAHDKAKETTQQAQSQQATAQPKQDTQQAQSQQKTQTSQRQVNLHGYTKEEIIAFAENYAAGKAELMPMGWYNFVEAINGLGNDIPDDKKASIDTAKNKAMAEIGVFEEYFGLDKMQDPAQIAKNMEHLDTLLKEMDLSGGKTKPKYEINEPAKDNTVNFQGMNLEYVVSKLQRSDLKPEDRAKLIQMAANYVNSDKFANVKFDRGSTEGMAKVLGNNEWLLGLLKKENKISDDVFNKKKEHLERKKAAFEEAVFNKQDYNEELDNANALLDRIVFTRPKHLNKAFGIKGEEKEYNEKYQQKLKELFKEQVKQEVYIHLANTLPEGEITKEKFEEEYALRLQSKILGLQGIDEFYKTGGEKPNTEEQIKKLLGNEKIVINSRALASFQAGSIALTSKAISLMQGRKGFEKIAEKLNERNKNISYEASNLHGVWISTAISSLKSVGWMGLYSLVGNIPNGIGIAAVSGVTFAMQVIALVKDVKAKKQQAEANFEKLTFRKYVSENKLRIGGLLLSGTSAALSTASIFYPQLIPIRTAIMYTGGALLGAGTIIAAVKAAPKGKKFRAFLSSLMVTASSYTGMALGMAMADNQAQPADTDSATNPGNTVSNESRGFFDNILDNVKGWLGIEKLQEQQLSDVKGDEQTRIVDPLDKEKDLAANVVNGDPSNVEVTVENIEATQNTETKYGDLTKEQMIRMFEADNEDVVKYLKDNHVIAADVTEFGKSKLIALLDSGKLQNHYEALSGIYENNFYENGSIKPDSWLNNVYSSTQEETVTNQDETIENNPTIQEKGQGGVAKAPYADNSSQLWHNPNFDPNASDANSGYDVTFTDNNLETLRDEKGLYKQYTFNSGEADQQVVKVYANGDKEVTQYENGKPYYIENIYTMENGVKVKDIVPAPGSDFGANANIVHNWDYKSPDNIKITVQEHTDGSISIMMNDTNNGSARSETYVNGELTEAKYYDATVNKFVQVENLSPDSKIVEMLGENHPASQGLDGSALEIDHEGQPNDNNTTVDPSVNNLSDDFKAKLPNDSHVVEVETETDEFGKTKTTIHTENGIFVDFGNNDMTGIAVVDGELKVYDEGGLVDYNPENEDHKNIVDNCQTLLGEGDKAAELSTKIDELQNGTTLTPNGQEEQDLTGNEEKTGTLIGTKNVNVSSTINGVASNETLIYEFYQENNGFSMVEGENKYEINFASDTDKSSFSINGNEMEYKDAKSMMEAINDFDVDQELKDNVNKAFYQDYINEQLPNIFEQSEPTKCDGGTVAVADNGVVYTTDEGHAMYMTSKDGQTEYYSLDPNGKFEICSNKELIEKFNEKISNLSNNETITLSEDIKNIVNGTDLAETNKLIEQNHIKNLLSGITNNSESEVAIANNVAKYTPENGQAMCLVCDDDGKHVYYSIDSNGNYQVCDNNDLIAEFNEKILSLGSDVPGNENVHYLKRIALQNKLFDMGVNILDGTVDYSDKGEAISIKGILENGTFYYGDENTVEIVTYDADQNSYSFTKDGNPMNYGEAKEFFSRFNGGEQLNDGNENTVSVNKILYDTFDKEVYIADHELYEPHPRLHR